MFALLSEIAARQSGLRLIAKSQARFIRRTQSLSRERAATSVTAIEEFALHVICLAIQNLKAQSRVKRRACALISANAQNSLER